MRLNHTEQLHAYIVECQYNSSRISMLLSVRAELNSYGMNNFCATTNNKENRVCTKKQKRSFSFTSFSDIELPLWFLSSHSVAFCTIRLVGPSQICLGEKQKKRMKVEQSASVGIDRHR